MKVGSDNCGDCCKTYKVDRIPADAPTAAVAQMASIIKWGCNGRLAQQLCLRECQHDRNGMMRSFLDGEDAVCTSRRRRKGGLATHPNHLNSSRPLSVRLSEKGTR